MVRWVKLWFVRIHKDLYSKMPFLPFDYTHCRRENESKGRRGTIVRQIISMYDVQFFTVSTLDAQYLAFYGSI